MPRGIPNTPSLGPSANTQRLLDAMHDLEQRLAAEKARDRARGLLLSFAQKHGLSAIDLRNAAKLLADRKVGDAPVLTLRRKSTMRLDKANPAKGKIGKAIRAARIKAGLTDRAIAERFGVAVSVVNGWQSKGKAVAEPYRATLVELLKLPKATFPAKAALSNGAAAH